MEEPQTRRGTMLSEQHSVAAVEPSSPTSARTLTASSSNLRELLTVRQEEDLQPLCQSGGRQGTSLSLGTVIAFENRNLSSPALAAATFPSGITPSGSRTLFDIIRDEESPGVGRGNDGVIIGSASGSHKISWRAFKDRLRIRRANAIGGSDIPDNDDPADDLILPSGAASAADHAPERRTAPERNLSFARTSAVEATRPPIPAIRTDSLCRAPSTVEPVEGSNRGSAAAAAIGSSVEAQQPEPVPEPHQPQQIRVSLMALLEQTDMQGDAAGFPMSGLLEVAGEEAEEEEEEEGGGGGEEAGNMYVKCCVCMVRHKGAAFIPCGHTFCRLCSRELWVSRGNCPLCNGFILEILDIF